MKLSVELIELEEEIIARCPELDINCYGSEKNEAVKRLKDVIQFYVDSAKEFGLEVDGFILTSIEGQALLTPSAITSLQQPTSIN